MSTNSTAHTAGRNIKRAIEFAWGYRNYVGGSDDWRCDEVYGRATDEYGATADRAAAKGGAS